MRIFLEGYLICVLVYREIRPASVAGKEGSVARLENACVFPSETG